MRTITSVILVAALAFALGCTTPPDWIDRTLVTVDVTGNWHGWTLANTGSGSTQLWLELKQEGPRAKGSVRAYAGYSQFLPVNGPIEGTVAGDVFSFRQTNGSLTGEMRMSGDEMTGEIAGAPWGRFAITLQRAK